jgi:hypothetical protein
MEVGMKKMLLLTIALLALGATIAAAQDGSNDLAWGTSCRSGAVVAAQDNQSAIIAGIPCNDSSDPMAAAPTKTLTASFHNTVTVNNWSGTTTMATFVVAGGVAPGSIWDINAGGCNSGGLSQKATIATTVANCTNPFALAPTDGQSTLPNVQGSSTGISYSNDRVRNTTQVTLGPSAAVGGWVSDQFVFDFDSAAQTQSCPGCTQGVDVKLTEIQYFSSSQLFHATTTNLKNCTTWNGGTGNNCAGATASKRSTWGAVKALYR